MKRGKGEEKKGGEEVSSPVGVRIPRCQIGIRLSVVYVSSFVRSRKIKDPEV